MHPRHQHLFPDWSRVREAFQKKVFVRTFSFGFDMFKCNSPVQRVWQAMAVIDQWINNIKVGVASLQHIPLRALLSSSSSTSSSPLSSTAQSSSSKSLLCWLNPKHSIKGWDSTRKDDFQMSRQSNISNLSNEETIKSFKSFKWADDRIQFSSLSSSFLTVYTIILLCSLR